MNHPSNNLRTRLFSWYLVSLIILAIFFYAAVHIFMLPYSSELFFVLLFILAVAGFFTVKNITSSLTNLSEQMRLISSHNLDKHIKGIHSNDEIGELAKSFNEVLDRLNDAFKREQQFIADVAHELKTPLSTQRSGLEITLSKNRGVREYKAAIDEALQENNQISSTLNNVLDLAWSETPYELKQMEKLNLSELMDELKDIALKMAIQKHITVDRSIKKNIYITSIKDKLARAILNIIDNAIKYTPPDGTVSISLGKKNDKGMIVIADTGVGIMEQDIPHISDRFYRGSKTEKILGSGLGLAISKSIILSHRGEIKIKSIVGKGSTFTILLPLAT